MTSWGETYCIAARRDVYIAKAAHTGSELHWGELHIMIGPIV